VQPSTEGLLLEVVVCCDGFRDVPLPHQDEADGVAKGVAFVGACFQDRQSLRVQLFPHPLGLYLGMVDECAGDREDWRQDERRGIPFIEGVSGA
jgi:hypothetical protein